MQPYILNIIEVSTLNIAQLLSHKHKHEAVTVSTVMHGDVSERYISRIPLL